MAQAGLADALRARTRLLHREAERTGVVADLLRGTADLDGYALLLRNLLPVYRAMEAGLVRRRRCPGVRQLVRPEVFRCPALQSDLAALAGPGWRRLPVLTAGRRYARGVVRAAAGDGHRLIAHAYARYLGDLNGGRVLRHLLVARLDLAPAALGFYDYPAVADLAALRRSYRQAFDAAGEELEDPRPVLDEAEAAFRFNIELSLAVQGCVGPPANPGAGEVEGRSAATVAAASGIAVGVPQ